LIRLRSHYTYYFFYRQCITCSIDMPCRVSISIVANSRNGHSAGPNSASSTWSKTCSTSLTTVGFRILSAVNSAGSSMGFAWTNSGPRTSLTVSSEIVSDVDNGSRSGNDGFSSTYEHNIHHTIITIIIFFAIIVELHHLQTLKLKCT
jgi:hypothetical protein